MVRPSASPRRRAPTTRNSAERGAGRRGDVPAPNPWRSLLVTLCFSRYAFFAITLRQDPGPPDDDPLLQRVGSRLGDLRILLGCHAGHADRSDDLAIDDD